MKRAGSTVPHDEHKALQDDYRAMQDRAERAGAKCDGFRAALAELTENVEEWIELEFVLPGDSWLKELMERHGVDPKTLAKSKP